MRCGRGCVASIGNCSMRARPAKLWFDPASKALRRTHRMRPSTRTRPSWKRNGRTSSGFVQFCRLPRWHTPAWTRWRRWRFGRGTTNSSSGSTAAPRRSTAKPRMRYARTCRSILSTDSSPTPTTPSSRSTRGTPRPSPPRHCRPSKPAAAPSWKPVRRAPP